MPFAIPILGNFDGDMGNQKLINVAAGSDPGDAANKGQLDVALAAKADLIAGTVPIGQVPSLPYVPNADKGAPNGVATLDAAGTVPAGQIPSLPYVSNAEKAAPNGVATLDATGKVPAAQLPSSTPSSPFAFKMTAAGAVNLNVTTEQPLNIPHGQAAAPNAENMIQVDVIQDDPAVDTSAMRWAAGYPIYDKAASTSTNARILVRFSAGAGVAATGRARIFFVT